MVLRVDVVEAALRARYGDDPVAVREHRRVIALEPSGRVLDDALVDELAAAQDLTLLCGRYEGFDERIVEHFATDRLSIGRYVLAGGELAATRCCASSPGRSGTPTARSRSPSAPPWRAVRSTRTTRVPPSGGGGRCRRSCCPVTTLGSRSGVWSRAARGREVRRGTSRRHALEPRGARHPRGARRGDDELHQAPICSPSPSR
jgi:hypothetical protein